MSRQVRIQHTRNYAQSRLFLLYNSHVIPDKIARVSWPLSGNTCQPRTTGSQKHRNL